MKHFLEPHQQIESVLSFETLEEAMEKLKFNRMSLNLPNGNVELHNVVNFNQGLTLNFNLVA